MAMNSTGGVIRPMIKLSDDEKERQRDKRFSFNIYT
jgi:hypothetical protein